MSEIEIDLEDPETLKLWTAVGELVERLPGQWVLIGGLMVQLHAVEHGVTDMRPTNDIDVLGQARPQGALPAIHAALRSDGFELLGPDLDGYAHRYERDGRIVDVLAPDGISPPPDLGIGLKAIGVPGGSQALTRSETVTVTVEGHSFELRRPTLLGAVLIKARSLMVHHDPESQREDLLRLLALIEDPREMAAELRKKMPCCALSQAYTSEARTSTCVFCRSHHRGCDDCSTYSKTILPPSLSRRTSTSRR